MILGEAFNYITKLKQQNDEMLLSGGEKVQGKDCFGLICWVLVSKSCC